MSTSEASLPLQLGARTVATIPRRLVRVPMPLATVTGAGAPDLPPLPPHAHGYLIRSLPRDRLGAMALPGFAPFVRGGHRRHFVDLDRDFDAYMASFSAKTRSTLRRKLRRFAERSGGAIDVRAYRSPQEVEQFHRLARGVSRLTYQEKRLGAGLPDGPEALAEMRKLAARDAMRGWLLFLDGQPISYLYAPAEGDTLIYAYLGYDPAMADLSPGTVLQLEALRMLMEERRFALFDFTEGEGQHKSLFGTGFVDCVDLILMRRTLGNALALAAVRAFDAGVASLKHVARTVGAEKMARARLR